MDKDKFREIAEKVESEWKMGGLSFGLYYDYAFEICKRYIEDRHLTNKCSQPEKPCKFCDTKTNQHLTGCPNAPIYNSGG